MKKKLKILLKNFKFKKYISIKNLLAVKGYFLELITIFQHIAFI